MRAIIRSLRYFRPFAWQTGGALLLMVVTIGLGTLRPWPLAILVDTVLGESMGADVPDGASWVWRIFDGWDPRDAVAVLAASVVALQVLWGTFQFWHTWILVRVGLQALMRARAELYACLQSLPLKFHDARHSGDSTFRVTYDTQSIQTIYNRGLATVLSAVLSLAMMFGVMWACSWKLTLVALAIVPLLIVAIYFFADRIRRESSEVQKEESDVLSKAQEGLSSVRIVQAFGRRRREVTAFLRECEQSLSANLRLTMTNVSSSFVVGLITACGTALLYWVGGNQVVAGEISVGTFVLFTSYLVMLYQPLEQLSYTGWALAGAAAGAQRVFEILDTEDSVPEKEGAPAMGPVRGQVTFDEVTFEYEAGAPVLRGLSMVIEPGETVAFVGATGAGKSTLLALVPRFYDPTSGRVLFDGKDLRDHTKQSVRAQVSLVLQDTLLLSTTIRENIAYGKPRASQEEIIEAAKQARAHDFIVSLPEGYDTRVGERGVRLSGGQRQRVAIARAFLKNAPILVLDEPTSALDAETEGDVMAAVERLMEGRTTLIVAHRLTTVREADRICVLRDGRVAEVGRHDTLLAKGGEYARLWGIGRG